MIAGLGEDLVAIARIERILKDRPDGFLNRCFTAREREKAAAHSTTARRAAYFAKRYAGKEACLKALGTGMRAGMGWHDMDIGNDEWGRPVMTLSGGVLARMQSLAPGGRVHITLSDEAGLAHATVIIET